MKKLFTLAFAMVVFAGATYACGDGKSCDSKKSCCKKESKKDCKKSHKDSKKDEKTTTKPAGESDKKA